MLQQAQKWRVYKSGVYIGQIAETMLIKTQNYYKAVLAMLIYADYHMVGFERKEHINY